MIHLENYVHINNYLLYLFCLLPPSLVYLLCLIFTFSRISFLTVHWQHKLLGWFISLISIKITIERNNVSFIPLHPPVFVTDLGWQWDTWASLTTDRPNNRVQVRANPKLRLIIITIVFVVAPSWIRWAGLTAALWMWQQEAAGTNLSRPSWAAAPPVMTLVMKMLGSSPMWGLSMPPAMLKPSPELPWRKTHVRKDGSNTELIQHRDA